VNRSIEKLEDLIEHGALPLTGTVVEKPATGTLVLDAGSGTLLGIR
jgi:hypothetical protein